MQIDVPTSERVEVLDVTGEVEDAVPENATGTCTVFVPHTTAGVTINENERRLLADLTTALDRLVPEDEDYGHNAVDDNADAHIRSMLLGSSVTVPVEDGDLGLGTWQSLLFVESDGPRTRRLTVTVG